MIFDNMLLIKRLEVEGVELILASQSPRRRQLMEDCHLPFEVVCYEVEEIYPETIDADQVAEYLAKLKSDGYPLALNDHQILLTADTVVISDNKILGKPKSHSEAKEMLSQISGREHKVITGVALRSKSKSKSFSCESFVKFATLTPEEIDFYVENYSPLDKAGSYGIQEWIGYIGIEGIRGSFYNVMGLPIQRVYTELNNFI